MVKNLPGMQETWVQSLVQEDILKKEIVIHSTILSWRIPWTEDPGGPQSMGLQRVGHNSASNTHTYRHTHTHRFGSQLLKFQSCHIPAM